MATLSDVATTIADMLARSDLTTQIKGEIARSVQQLNREVSHLTELRALSLTTAGAQVWYDEVDASAAEGYSAAQSATMSTEQITEIVYMRKNPGPSGVDEPMMFLPYRRFETLQEGSVTSGDPQYYTVYAGLIGLWPSPNAGIELEISAHVRPVVPTDDADTSVYFDEAGELIEAMTAARVALKYLHDPELAQMHGTVADAARKAMALETAHKVGSGRIAVHD